MKLTANNELCLKLMGFFPEDPNDKNGWWRLKDGWSFDLGHVRNISVLVNRLMKTEYERGLEDGLGLKGTLDLSDKFSREF